MSKLAHSNDSTMRQLEISRVWSECGPDEACEIFDRKGIAPSEVFIELGGGPAMYYENWIYLNMK